MRPKGLRCSWDGTLYIAAVAIPLKMAPASSSNNDPLGEDAQEGLKMACPQCAGEVGMVFYCKEHPDFSAIVDMPVGHPVSLAREGSNRVYDDGAHRIPLAWHELDGLLSNMGQQIIITEVRPQYNFDFGLLDGKIYRAWTTDDDGPTLAAFLRTLDRNQWIAIGYMIQSRRKYMVALRTNGRKSLEVLRLHWPDDVRTGFPATTERADSAMVKMFDTILEGLEVDGSDPVGVTIKNTYRDGLRELLTEKVEDLTMKQLQASVDGG